MYLLTVDSQRELVYLAFVDRFDVDEAKRCRTDVQGLLPTLRPGFRLLTDLTALEEMDLACADEIRPMMDELRKHGISQVVRVIPDHKKDIGFTVMSYFHYGQEVRVQTVESLSQALRALRA